eukprot:PhF_6_TR10592/c0_g1_i3/m.16982/K03243/EIF5B; translation initiation factor 5B
MPPKAPPKAAPKKALPTGLAAMKAQLAKAKEEEERRIREEAEEQARIEAEEKRQAEEAERKEQEKLRKLEDKDSEGVKKKYIEQQKKIDELRAAGYKVPDLVVEAQKGKVDRHIYAKKKPVKPKAPEPTAPRPESYAIFGDEPEEEKKDGEVEDDQDSQDGDAPEQTNAVEPVVAPPKPREAEEVVDSWEELAVDDGRNFAEEIKVLLQLEQQGRNQLTTSEENDRKATSISEAKRKKLAKVEEEKAKEKQVKELRSPICCVLGHVDAGKTSLLDKLRRTNVQGGEAGGITQQIGATFFPLKSLLDQTKDLAEQYKFTVRIPGLLIIDTPGHESFTNLRSRGSGLCDIAIVVVDFTKGIEPQTRESLNLLRERKCSFIVAMNKCDRLYGWKAQPGKPIQHALKMQEKFVAQEYETRVHNIASQLMAEGFNSALYYQNKDFRKVVSLVPVSAHTGEGIPDLLALVVQLIQKFMEAKVTVGDNLACTVLEVKKDRRPRNNSGCYLSQRCSSVRRYHCCMWFRWTYR